MDARGETVMGGALLWLIVPTGDDQAKIVEVAKDRFVIGRDEGCDLPLDDSKVSREHAVIRVGPGRQPELEDLNSRNGTFVNGVALKPELGYSVDQRPAKTKLTGSEWIRCGDTMMLVSLVDPKLNQTS